MGMKHSSNPEIVQNEKDNSQSSEVQNETPSGFEAINDPRPTRIVNPLLEMPPYPISVRGGSVPIDDIPNAAEIWNIMELYFTDPDTYPLEYWARLLGFILPNDWNFKNLQSDDLKSISLSVDDNSLLK